eukprot:GCRY01000466.1.p1 GENE.GCRY01000466.1~~GCRY01000466.1.p1  ORF type:complete len:541 (+),score=145.19 GCRY01000466.1:150-1772(+)
MNPNAPTFNPSASVFVPSFAAPKTEEPKEEEAPENWDQEEEEEKTVKETEKKVEEIKIEDESPKKPKEDTKESKIELDHIDGEEELLAEMELEAAREEEEQRKKLLERGSLKKHVNIVFMGHVDAGKSTLSGHIMYLTGMVDDRTLEKYEREAKEKNRESWKFAWALDTTADERAKGKTEECGRGYFETENKRFTILDAPGHKGFIPYMIGGASQADVGVLVISARKGEFETGFMGGGQTREHAVLARTSGVRHLFVLVNKMDDPTVEWDKARYDEILKELFPFLKSVGFNPKKDVVTLPVSGLSGANLKEAVSPSVCKWASEYSPFLTLLDEIKPPERLVDAPMRLPIIDKYREMGTVVMGKLESGTIAKGEKLVMMPNRVTVEVLDLTLESFPIEVAEPGDNVKIKLKGVEEEDIRPGFVLCPQKNLVHYVSSFVAQIIILEHKSIITAGYSCMLHIHAAQEECSLDLLIAEVDKKTNEVKQKRPKFVKAGSTVRAKLSVAQPICAEAFKDFQQLGRFILRDEGKTIGIGVVLKLLHE